MNVRGSTDRRWVCCERRKVSYDPHSQLNYQPELSPSVNHSIENIIKYNQKQRRIQDFPQGEQDHFHIKLVSKFVLTFEAENSLAFVKCNLIVKYIIQYSVYTRDMIGHCQLITMKWSLTVDKNKNFYQFIEIESSVLFLQELNVNFMRLI